MRVSVGSFLRYLFCKERLPTGTEFAVLDLLDDLEAGAKAAREKDRAKSKNTREVRVCVLSVLACPCASWQARETGALGAKGREGKGREGKGRQGRRGESVARCLMFMATSMVEGG